MTQSELLYEEFLSLETTVLHHSQLTNRVAECVLHVDMLTAAVTYLLAHVDRRLSSHATFVNERIPEYFRWIHGNDADFEETFAVHCLPILESISNLGMSQEAHDHAPSEFCSQNVSDLFLECFAKALSFLRVALMLGDADWAYQEMEFLHNMPAQIQCEPQSEHSSHFYFGAVVWPTYWNWSQQTVKHSAKGVLHKVVVDQILERLSKIAEVKWNPEA